MLYLDTSALMKLVRMERETTSLRAWLEARPDELLVTSGLTEVELPRALRRLKETEAIPRALDLLETNMLILELDPDLRRAAAELPDSVLRSLDAIHLASAYELRPELSALVTYDRRMAQAAEPEVVVASPGVELTELT